MDQGIRVTSAKSAARKATAIAAAALGVSVPVLAGSTAARASGIGPTFLYRSLDTAVKANCTGGNHEIRNVGNVNLGYYYVWGGSYLGGSAQGNFAYSYWSQIASTKVDKQEWCYGGDFYYQNYAANAYNRIATLQYYCWAGSCQYYTTTYTAWVPGV